MRNTKKIIILSVAVLVLSGVIFFLFNRQKKNIIPEIANSNNNASLPEKNISPKEINETGEKLSLVAGKIISLRGNFLTLLKISPNLSQNEESSINLKIPQVGAQFFSQNGTEKKEIEFSDVKPDSFVNVEYRESTGEVVKITVIETDKTEEKT